MSENLPIPLLDQLPGLTWKEKLAYLGHQFSKLETAMTDCPVTHHFEPGYYIREMRIPADTLFIGRAHRLGHLCRLIEGSVVHISEQERRTADAPFEMCTTPGYHMVLYTLTDIVGHTIHPNPDESRDTDALEATIFETSEELKSLGESLHRRLAAS